MTRGTYYIRQTKPASWTRFVPLLWEWPYTVYEGNPSEWPLVHMVGIAQSKRGARRLIRREKTKFDFSDHIVVVEEGL